MRVGEPREAALPMEATEYAPNEAQLMVKIASGETGSSERPFERAYEVVAAKIATLIQKKYEIGDRLPSERLLASRFGVSRPTLREALLRLSMDGIVDVKKNSGVFVARRSGMIAIKDVGVGPFEHLAARLIFEPEVAAKAAPLITDVHLDELSSCLELMRWEHDHDREADKGDHRFHVAVAAATGNSLIATVVDMLWSSQTKSEIWAKIHSYLNERDNRPLWLDDHTRIFEALRSKIPAAAKTEMHRHLKNIETVLLAGSSPAMTKPAASRSV
jgi:GntR family uxuAB operon transcriptional repressor